MLVHQASHFTTLLLMLAATAAGDDVRFTYNGFVGANLTLDGAAMVTASGLLTLTNGTIQMKGHAFHPTPLQLRAAQNDDAGDGGATMRAFSFSTTFVFAIFGPYDDTSSHGLAFLVSANREVLSTALPSQFLGLVNVTSNGTRSARVFAVEFDTILNAEFRDIDSNHVGVDVNGVASIEAASAGYYDDGTGTFRNLSLISRKAMQVWVDYYGASTELVVAMVPLGMARPKRPLLRTTVNLSDVVQGTAYVGFSSSTGVLSSRHIVLGWSFSQGGVAAAALNISALPALPPASLKTRSTKMLKIVLLPTTLTALALTMGAVLCVLVRRRIKYAELLEDWEIPFGLHRFSYKDLFHATDGFSDDQLLGVGGFGRVYKGVLHKSNTEVAVKRVSHESRQGMKEFVAEVASIGRLRHRNIVQLLGYCRRKGELILVYDYMPKQSLDKYLYNKSGAQLEWPQRFRIIRGVASGLLYLHEEWERVVIHRDIKTSNVLLDREMNACLGDFGLARLYDHEADARTTHIVGTTGYMAPELGHTGKATPATDVFAFGAFLLEVTSGRRPMEEDKHSNPVILMDWVMEHLSKGSITDAVDTRLLDGFDPDEVSLVLKLGLLCSHPMPNRRPTMRHVIQYLDGDRLLPDISPTDFIFTVITTTDVQSHREELNQNVALDIPSLDSDIFSLERAEKPNYCGHEGNS